MTKKLAITLAVLMLAIVAWGLFLESNAVTIIINGQQVTGPLKGAIGAAGLVVALIALFCAAILLVFVFAGIGIIVLGCFIFVGIILAWLTFPFLLPLLIPLAILWGFVAITRRTSTS
jgi:predicted exporter